MARETYESKLKCPVCGREGLADMSGAKSYKIGDCDTRVDAVTEGFAIKNKTELFVRIPTKSPGYNGLEAGRGARVSIPAYLHLK
jgi:hypothetical protein